MGHRSIARRSRRCQRGNRRPPEIGRLLPARPGTAVDMRFDLARTKGGEKG
jgi:hypothetical protein